MQYHRRSRAIIAILTATATFDYGVAQQTAAKLSIDHVDMKPTKNGFYDATVGLVMKDAKLGKTGTVTFSVVIPDVHDADEAISKVHDSVKTLSEDLRNGYRDLHREP